MEPIKDLKNFHFPNGHRWRFYADGVKYVVRYSSRKDRWSIRFKRNGLKVCVNGHYYNCGQASADAVSVNGFTWKFQGSVHDTIHNWYVVNGHGIGKGLPANVVKVANQVLARMAAQLTPIYEEQLRIEAASREASRLREEERKRKLQSDTRKHYSKILQQLD